MSMTADAHAAPLLSAPDGEPRHVRVAIIGAGFGGLCMAIKLRQAGEQDFVVLERAKSVGGTWRDNHYPGCECDVPSHLYSYSFELNPDWSTPYGQSDEIRAYIERCTDRYGVRPHIQFGQALTEATFDADAQRWQCVTADGHRFSADILVHALGGLSNPFVPALQGLQRFAGPQFHSARWDHGCQLGGKRVVIVGTGASTIQFLAPVAERAHHVTLFQRTPAWVLPKDNAPFSRAQRWAFRHIPGLCQLERTRIFARMEARAIAFQKPRLMRYARTEALAHMHAHIHDPELRRKLTPDYIPGCKRILLSNDFYPALARDNVSLETDGIAEVTERGVVTRDGRRVPADVLIFGTGFDVHGRAEERHRIVGRDGAVLGGEGSSREAYLGAMVTGFPNLFMLTGPNAGLGHNSILIMIEGAVQLTLQAMARMRQQGARTIEPSLQAQTRFNAWVQKRLQHSVWESGCKSWYLDEDGRNRTIWPGPAAAYAWATRHLRRDDFVLDAR